MEEQREEGTLRVEDAMRPASRAVLDTVLEAHDSLDQVLQRWDAKLPEVRLVRLDPTGWSIITRQALEIMVKEGKGNLTLGSALSGRQILFLHPDNPLETALRYVDRWPLLPVVNRADFRKLEGVISQQDVLQRYQLFGEEEGTPE
jgi:CIC family chloride channel protein